MIKQVFFILSVFFSFSLSAQEKPIYQNHWQIKTTQSTHWDLKNDYNLPHQDNIEMSGKRVSAIVTYALDTAKILKVKRQIFFPQLRTLLKTTDPRWYVYRAYLKETYTDDILPHLVLDNEIYVPTPVKSITLDGTLTVEHETDKSGLQVSRRFFPSPSERLFVEQWTLRNTTDKDLEIRIANQKSEEQIIGAKGLYNRVVSTHTPSNSGKSSSTMVSSPLAAMY